MASADGADPHAVNLLDDPLLLAAPRVDFKGRFAPALGGIPILSPLGQGGMGAVYRAFHPRLNRFVAVKLLPFALAKSRPQLLERFLREAQLASQVQSPHLIQVLDVNQESGLPYLVMELVDGMSARGVVEIKQQTGALWLDESIALRICIAASKGLAAAHARGIVHRDVKPDNILVPSGEHGLDYDGAKLADLGLARGEDGGPSLTGSMDVMGTPGYMAPEQAMDSKGVGKEADVFGLGATLYGLVTGQAPFTGESTVQVVFATMNKAHVPAARQNPRISRATSVLIDHCLSKNPARRYADGAVLQQALETCLDSVGKDAAQDTALERLVWLINSGGKGAGEPGAPKPSAMQRLPGAEMDELDAILKKRPKERTWMRPGSGFRFRLAIAFALALTGMWGAAYFNAQRNASLSGYMGGDSGEGPLYQSIQNARAARASGDAAQIQRAVLELEDGMAEPQGIDHLHLDEAQMILSELRTMQGRTNAPPAGKTPAKGEVPTEPFRFSREVSESGEWLTRVYSRPEELEAPHRLRQLAAPPSGRALYALCEDRAAILVLEPETLKVAETIPLAKNPVSLWCEETRIAAACDQSQLLALIDPATHEVVKAIPIPEALRLTPQRIVGRHANGDWLVVCTETGTRNPYQRTLLHVSETGAVRKALEGQIDWGFYLPGDALFCAQRLGKGMYEKPVLFLRTATGKIEPDYTRDFFPGRQGLTGAYSYIFQTADRRHAVIPCSKADSTHGFQAWTYLASADVKRVELDCPGLVVGEVANEGLLVSWGTVVEKGIHQSSRVPDVFYVSRSTGRVVRRVTLQNYPGSNSMHTTVLPERNTLFLPRQERLLWFGERMDGKVLSIRCGPVAEEARVHPDPNILSRGEPPREIPAGRALEYDPQLVVTGATADVRLGQNPVLALREPPRGASVDPASGRITWTPGAAQIGNHEFLLEARFSGKAVAPVRRFTVRVTP